MTGRLFYLMGASGAGKDSLLQAFRQSLRAHPRCLVAHRYITRQPQPGGENDIYLPPAEFQQHRQLGAFCLVWHSHGHRYALGLEVEQWLALGIDVLVNGSRAHLSAARRRFPGLIPVLVDADPDQLRARLQARGRESSEQIDARLTRATRLDAGLPGDCRRVDNSGTLEYALEQLQQQVQVDSGR